MSRLRLMGLLVVLGMTAGWLMGLGCGEETTIIKEVPPVIPGPPCGAPQSLAGNYTLDTQLVSLTWEAPSGCQVAGYRVYHHTEPLSEDNKDEAIGNETINQSFWDFLPLGVGFIYYRVSAVDKFGQESLLSNQLMVVTRGQLAFRADKDTDSVYELYTVAPDGSGLTKVSGTLFPDGDASSPAFSPDGTMLAFLADKDDDDVYELYTVAPDGSGLTKVSGTLGTGGDVGLFKLSPDGTRIAYGADAETDNVYELYTVAPDGSELTKVSGTLVTGGEVYSFVWVPSFVAEIP